MNRAMQLVAEKLLYHRIDLSSEKSAKTNRMEKFCRTLAQHGKADERNRRASDVKELSVYFPKPTEGLSYATLILLLRQAVGMLRGLEAMTLELSEVDRKDYSDILACLSTCPTICLQTFDAEICISGDRPIYSFLLRQPDLKNLYHIKTFRLPASHLHAWPNLEHIKGSTELLKILVPGRPVQRVLSTTQVSTALLKGTIIPVLARSTAPIQDLYMALDDYSADIIDLLSNSFPQLQKLTIISAAGWVSAPNQSPTT